jgi:hypothetical protein
MLIKSDTMSTQPPLMDIIQVCFFRWCSHGFMHPLRKLLKPWEEIQGSQD